MNRLISHIDGTYTIHYEYEFIEEVGFVIYDNENEEHVATCDTEKEAIAYCSPPTPEHDDVGMPLNGWATVVTG